MPLAEMHTKRYGIQFEFRRLPFGLILEAMKRKGAADRTRSIIK